MRQSADLFWTIYGPRPDARDQVRLSASHGIAGNAIGRGFCRISLSTLCGSGPRFDARPVAVANIRRVSASDRDL